MITYGSYDYKLQIRLYEFNNTLISWEESYDTPNKVLNKEIHEVKFFWKTSYLVTWRISHCGSNILKNDVRINKLDAWKIRKDVTWDARNIVTWKAKT